MADKKESKKEKGSYRVYLGAIFNVDNSKVLVAENVFTRKPVIIKTGTSIKPFYTVKKVVDAANVSSPGNFTEPLKASSKDGYDLGCLFSWTSTIVDPIKFTYASANPEQVFNSILLQGLKSYVKERDYETLSKEAFDINAVGAAQNLRNDLIVFEAKYGIRINEIRITDIIPPKELEEAYRQKAAQKSENERRELEAQSKLKVAKINKEIAKSDGQGKASSLKEIQKSGLSPMEAASYDVETRYAEKANTVNRWGGNNIIMPLDEKGKTR